MICCFSHDIEIQHGFGKLVMLGAIALSTLLNTVFIIPFSRFTLSVDQSRNEYYFVYALFVNIWIHVQQ